MVKSTIEYTGNLHCVAVHGPSGAQIETDAPVDNHGRGEAFSPTDLCATSLGVCMATVMGIAAEKRGIDIKGLRMEVTKEMSTDAPRRIARITVEIWMPVPEDNVLRNIAETCPVQQSLNPAIDIQLIFHWAK